LQRLWEHHHLLHDNCERCMHSHLGSVSALSKLQDFHHDKPPLKEWEQAARIAHKMHTFSISSAQLLDGSLEDQHWQVVEQALFKNIPHKRGHVSIQEIQYIVNPRIEKEFDLMKEEVGGEILFGFHGTREANIKHICRENFSLSRCKSPTKLGGAIWFSMDPLQALMYVPDEKKSKKLILAKIISGSSYHGMCKHAYDECVQGHCDKYNTVVDGNVIIALDDALILPCYIVTVSDCM